MQYRAAFSEEAGPYIGPPKYDVRAMGGSTTTQLFCRAFPIQSGIPQDDALIDRPLYRPTATQPTDRHRYVMKYTPGTGLIQPDLEWAMPPIPTVGGATYDDLEAYMYADMEFFIYDDLEHAGLEGIGERFEILGPFDVPTTHQLINDGLKQCWLVVEVIAQPTQNATRHDLSLVCPWLQDATDILQVGVLSASDDRNMTDPYGAVVRGQVEQDGGRFYFNTGGRSFNSDELLYLKVLKRAYDHCCPHGGTFGQQVGLELEDDESPVERDWLVSSALVIAWRRYAKMLEPIANQRLIRDQASANAWFSDRCREHFSQPLPQRTFKPQRSFGPPALV